MLLKTVTFDEKNYNWSNDQEYNIMFLRTLENHANDVIRHRGYMYLNQICEHLGVGWNPDDENPCVRNDGVNRIAFVQFGVFKQADDSFLVHIHCYD